MDERGTPTDEDTALLAGELHERVRALNSLTKGAPGLTQPGTAYTVLANLAQTAFRLAQTAEQVDKFLDAELAAGRLGNDRGEDPVPTVLRAHDALALAAEHAQDLGESFRRAGGALVSIHARDVDEDPKLRSAVAPAPFLGAEADPTPGPEVAGTDFPTPIEAALPKPDQPEPGTPNRGARQKPPRPRREI
ncbi:hypothetical protein [Actinomadura roseirufa]|uniref:hypothetical protein n=1 Tax=Actinomadura roseirufa TaxID=2094049 RepID=UPI001041427B|nr:hypothetical protein [Actinomadura roseirufa]